MTTPRVLLNRPGVVVVVATTVATLAKLLIAARTYGTDDVWLFSLFAQGVARFGPVDIYGHPFFLQYNHGPLTGYLLALVNLLSSHGVPFPFLIRAPACLADVGTTYLLYRLVGKQRGQTGAALCAILFVLSPVTMVVSGFDGQTDPVWVMFSLLSLFLLTSPRRVSIAAGVAFGIAISIKLVPVVLMPYLAYLAWRRGRSGFRRFLAGGALVFLLLWVPVLALRWPQFRDNVLLYKGTPGLQWGLSELLNLAHWESAQAFLNGPYRFIILVVSAIAPFLLVRTGRVDVLAAAGFPLAIFLALSPTFGMHYLVWPLAGVYLVSPRWATWYNGTASVFVLVAYSQWSWHFPWGWDVAYAGHFAPLTVLFMLLTWLTLILLVLVSLEAVRRGVSAGSLDQPSHDTHRPGGA